MSNVTPFVKRMRTSGGTIYVFSSATEDIGLNISERKNVVTMSNYALLNIPDIAAPSNPDINKFNVMAIPGAVSSFELGNTKDGGVILAESFQNYALNLEAMLTDASTYDPKLPTTVSERVFWKWLKETGAIRWQRPTDASFSNYWEEEVDTAGYNSVVQNVGEITAGAIRYDGYGSYNETYVLIPASYGKSKIYFKQVVDDNYHHDMIITGGTNILGRDNYTIPHPDALDYKAYYDLTASETSNNGYNLFCDGVAGWWTTNEGISFEANSYATDTASYLTDPSLSVTLKYYDGNVNDTIEFKRSKVDCVSIEYDLSQLYGVGTTFDDIAMKPLSIGENYEFNTVLIYYSVYATRTSTVPMSTNLLGVLFLDNASGNTSSIKISNPITINSTKKIQGGNSVYGSTGFGTSYSFRLNIQTDNMFDDTQSEIYDNSAFTTVLDDFQGVLGALEQSVNILNKQTSTINYISNQYVGISSTQSSILNTVSDLNYAIKGISRNITGSENTIPLFSSGINPLIDSSIYVYGNNYGIKTNRPAYDFQVNGDAAATNIFVNQSIKDFSGNILLGSGSYLNKAPFVQESSLGMSFYWSAGQLLVTGADVSVVSINNHLTALDASVVILNSTKASTSYVTSATSNYIKSASTGFGLKWTGGILDVSVSIPNTASFATITYVNTGLGIVDTSLNLKSDKTYVDASLNLKANLAYVDGSLNLKSDITYVDGSLNLKSDITYVDGSLALRDTSINDLSILLSDLSTNYYSKYLDTSIASIVTNSSVYVVVGNKLTDRSILVDYTSYRNTSYREGQLRILNASNNLYITDSYQENTSPPYGNISGLTFNAVYVDNSININVVTNASDGSTTTFKHHERIIGI